MNALPRHDIMPIFVIAGLLTQADLATAAVGRPVTGTLTRAQTWTVDQQGRVFVGHGFNIIRRVALFYPDNFTEKDARWLARQGFTTARIGLIWSNAEPKPGEYNEACLQKFKAFDALLGRYGIRTLVDFHQDQWKSNGSNSEDRRRRGPDWASLGTIPDTNFQCSQTTSRVRAGSASRRASSGFARR